MSRDWVRRSLVSVHPVFPCFVVLHAVMRRQVGSEKTQQPDLFLLFLKLFHFKSTSTATEEQLWDGCTTQRVVCFMHSCLMIKNCPSSEVCVAGCENTFSLPCDTKVLRALTFAFFQRAVQNKLPQYILLVLHRVKKGAHNSVFGRYVFPLNVLNKLKTKTLSLICQGLSENRKNWPFLY